MNLASKRVAHAALGISIALTSGCAGMAVSGFAHDDSYKLNAPKKAEACYDASVLLGADLARAKDIAKKVVVAVDATVNEENGNAITAQRNRHIGLFVGSGGEELFVSLKPVAPDQTFVTVATKTGFVGGAGQKAWSCQVVDEMVKMAAK